MSIVQYMIQQLDLMDMGPLLYLILCEVGFFVNTLLDGLVCL